MPNKQHASEWLESGKKHLVAIERVPDGAHLILDKVNELINRK